MQGSLQSKAMYISWAEMGIVIEKITEGSPTIFYISVPKDGDKLDSFHKKFYDEILAKKNKETMTYINQDFVVKYKVRDEYWTKEMAQAAKDEAYKMVM